jgi:hypothetical protein
MRRVHRPTMLKLHQAEQRCLHAQRGMHVRRFTLPAQCWTEEWLRACSVGAALVAASARAYCLMLEARSSSSRSRVALRCASTSCGNTQNFNNSSACSCG